MVEYGFLSKAEIRTDSKYGSNQSSIFAMENIKKGKVIHRCNPGKCGAYLSYLENSEGMTKDETEEFMMKSPKHRDFVLRYYTMIDDDAFNFDRKLREPCSCHFINHSCNSNATIDNDANIIAKKNIAAGEEITLDYQIFATENNLDNYMECKCGSHNCRNIINYSDYRNIDWVNENYKFCSVYLKKRIDELKTKWFSSSCFLLKYNNKSEIGLAVLKKVIKNQLVAIYSDPMKITRESHFLRHSDNPTCYVNEDGEVYVKDNLEPRTELTIDFKTIKI